LTDLPIVAGLMQIVEIDYFSGINSTFLFENQKSNEMQQTAK